MYQAFDKLRVIHFCVYINLTFLTLSRIILIIFEKKIFHKRSINQMKKFLNKYKIYRKRIMKKQQIPKIKIHLI